MEAQFEKSEKSLGTFLFKRLGTGIGLGFISSVVLANVAVGMGLGLIYLASAWLMFVKEY